jgi:hypothetical protein
MAPNRAESPRLIVIADLEQELRQDESCGEDAISLRRWLVFFASGREWYPVGEYVAVDAGSAIDRAVEVFGAASGYQAEEIPWDAAPLVRPSPLARRERR